MKILLIVLLCASLTANALLFVQTSRPHSALEPSASNQSSPPGELNLPTPPAAPPPTSAAISPEILALLSAQDPSGVQKLRDLGFSPKAIRALVRAQIDAQFRERELALTKRSSKEFWKRNYGFNQETYTARQGLAREKEAALKKLLGADYASDVSRPDIRLANLSPAKAQRIQALEEDYSEMSMAIRGNGFGSVQFPEDKEKLAYLEKEKRAELVQLLSPDELFEYDLRTSNVASSLRRSMAAFEPTEQEFREIFKLTQANSTALGYGSNEYSAELRQARQKAQENVDQQIKALLGDARFQAYQQANDPDYRRFYQIASRLQLPREAAGQAQAIKISIEDQRTKIQRDPEFKDPAKRASALQALSEKAEAELKPVLGAEGFEAYRQTSGSFLQRLRPPPVRPKS